MINRDKKITILTNLALMMIITVVCVISFIPQTSVPIYGGKRFSAIYNGNRNKANVSVMFNVYENTEIVNSIIDTLNEYDAKATFFVGGCWADDNETTLKRIVQEGHELANHGYFHKDHKKLNYENNRQEIENTGIIVKALSGVKMTLFAPPSGSYSETTLEVAYDLGYKVIMWSKDTIDWRDKNSSIVFDRATKNLTNGDLILMHPKEHTLQALPRILEFISNSGYKTVCVSENIAD